jgi:hypothetical protein
MHPWNLRKTASGSWAATAGMQKHARGERPASAGQKFHNACGPAVNLHMGLGTAQDNAQAPTRTRITSVLV